MNLATNLDQIKGVGPKTAAELRQAGLETVSDILLFLPRKHEDFTNVTPIAELQPGKVTIRARCQQISTRPVRRGLRLALEEPERIQDWMERGCRAGSRRPGPLLYQWSTPDLIP